MLNFLAKGLGIRGTRYTYQGYSATYKSHLVFEVHGEKFCQSFRFESKDQAEAFIASK